MAIIALHPNNKNQYRKYPFKQGSSLQSDSGYVIPDDFIVNCSITSIYGRHRIYVKQIYHKNGEFRISVASVIDDLLLGVFIGEASLIDFSTLELTPFVRNVSGTITLANTAKVTENTVTLHFNKANTELEESTIFCYTPPAVSSIKDKKNTELRGRVVFGNLINLTKSTDTEARTSRLRASNPESIYNSADKSTYLGNCGIPIIKNINGVQPSLPGGVSSVNDHNIYIVGVKPIVFYGIPGEEANTTEPGIIGVTTDTLTLDSLCTLKHKILPPVEVCGFTLPTIDFKNKYYSKPALNAADPETCDSTHPARRASNFNETVRPEFYYWPQFVKEEYYNYWKQP
jgi:hypothetical protein